MGFKGNPVLFYDNGRWGKAGYALANYGPRKQTANAALGNYVNQAGRNLSAIMHRPDIRSATPPSMDCILDINRLVLRARELISAEMLPEGQTDEGPVHDDPAKEPFIVYPVPYFFVRNPWLKKYCRLVFSSLSEAMQASRNDQPESIDFATAQVICRPLVRLYKSFCIELLHISDQDPNFPTKLIANKDLSGPDPSKPLVQPDWKAFTLNNDQLRSYRPSQWYTPTELIDTVTPNDDIPTAYDLLAVTSGIPVPELDELGPYPFTTADSALDTAPDPATLKPAAPGSGATASQTQSAAVLPAQPGQSTSAFP